MQNAALLLIDVQNDFCPGGSLAVRAGDEIVPVLNRYIEHFRAAGRPIFASRDWHPEKTSHFQAWGGVWPPHCIQGTRGAAFHAALDLAGAHIISKGMDPSTDSYSAFQGTDEHGRPLAALLRELGVSTVYVGGLATDYCVKASLLDASREQFATKLLLDGCRGVELQAGDAARAIEEMVRAGAEALTVERLSSWAERSPHAAPQGPAR